MDIEKSLNRILSAKDSLGELFYTKFLARHPEAQQFFDGVDMKRQSVLLTTALMMVERHSSNPTPAVEKYLEYMGTKHDDMKIPQALFADWADAMIETMSSFHGEQWNDKLEQQWRAAIAKATETMFVGYQRHVTI